MPLNIQINGQPVSSILALNVSEALIELQVIQYDRLKLNATIDYEQANANRNAVIAPLKQWALRSPHICPHCKTEPEIKDDSKSTNGKYYVGCSNQLDCPVWPIGKPAACIAAAIRLWNSQQYI